MVTGIAGFCEGVGPVLAGTDDTALGEVVALFFWVGGVADRPGGALIVGAAAVVPGGGGKGAIPRGALSFAAAAAAAEAYFSVSPGALVGRGAGFIAMFVVPFVVEARGVWRVASAGNGDFNWFDGLRAPVT